VLVVPMRANKKSTPKYFRITQNIAGAIRCGDLAPGVPIPSENELIERYRISNTTARRIHRELEQAGWVTRIKGKGTFVSVQRVDRSVDRILGFTKNMLETGHHPSTQLLGVKMRHRGRTMVINSRRYVLPGPVFEIERLRLADGMPMMRETRYVSTTLCPGIHKKNLEESLYDIYEKEYGLELVRVDQRLSAIIINGEEMGFPGVKGPIPAFLVEGATLCGKGMVLETEVSIYRGDIYHFSVQADAQASRAV
jgi:GntR family transcriptional regulator